ncbi:MAG: hypothetical protein Q7S80_00910 [bacterium]|nr:hypothetical protein [bacterium]
MRWGRDIKEIETALSPLQSVVNSDRAETVKIGELTFDVLPYMSPDWHRKTGPVIVAKEGSEVVVVVIVWRKTTSRPCVDLVNDLGSRYKRWSVVRAKLGLKQ